MRPVSLSRCLAVSLLCLGGCAGDAARVNALAPLVANTWPHVMEEAQLGIAARSNAAAARALGLAPESGEVGLQRQVFVQEFDRALRVLVKQK